MTEEQKKRIILAKENDCEFDGMPLHPHHYHYLVKAGFKSITEIEALTEKEFCKRIDDAFIDHEYHDPNRGKRCLKNLKNNGVVLTSEETDLDKFPDSDL